MKKTVSAKCLNILSAALIALAATTVTTASIWIFQYQPKTPKALLKG